jgi:hypothetical protein
MRVFRSSGLFLLAVVAIALAAYADTITVTNLDDDGPGSLRQAIDDADPGDTIEFAAGLTGTITLTTGELDIREDLTINGPGADRLTVSGNHDSRVFDIFDVDVTITGLTIADGDAGVGGGIYCERTGLDLIGCTIRDCDGDDGGGICVYLDSELYMENCTVSGNWAEEDGGGICSWWSDLELVNCTVSDNEADDGDGGGICVDEACLYMEFCTVTDNWANDRGGGVYYDPGAADCGGFDNTIFYGNDCVGDGEDFWGEFRSYGYNLIGDLYDDYDELANPGTDIFDEDPMLGPLQDNGGPTETHALLAGSPAIDAGSCEAADADIETDQRGVERPQGEACDIGAYEYEVRVNPPPGPSGCGVNRTPIPDAGEDQVACVGELVSLDGSRSYDPDEGIPPNVAMGETAPQYAHQRREDLKFQWEIAVLYYAAGRPVLAVPERADVHATAEGFDSEIGSFVPNVPGVYRFDLFVTDDFGDTASDRVTITVLDCPDFEPPPAAADEFRFERFIVYPNPSAGEVHFGFVGDGAADAITVTILDLGGNVVWEGQAAGAPVLVWDGRGSDGQLLAAGPYFYHVTLVAGGTTHRGDGVVFLRP